MSNRIQPMVSDKKQSGQNMEKIQNKNKKFQADEFDEKAIFLCQFCGGQKCPQEDYLTNKIQPNAIVGLHCNWITHNILAMQRPSQRIIKQFNLYERFKKQKINTILNLQQAGQHPYCGDGIMPLVGFSYYPQGFFKHGIGFFNESWQDMTATTFEHMMGIMNIFYNSLLNGGKISVHCHAGRGRTLLVICSWLIYNDRITAEESIDLAIQRRQGVLTKTSQRDFLKDFAKQLKRRWTTFGETIGENFTQFTETQKISFLRHEQRMLKLKPFIHYFILNQLRRRMRTSKEQASLIIKCMINAMDQSLPKWNQKLSKQLQQFKVFNFLKQQKVNNHVLFKKQQNKHLIQNADVRILIEMLYDFYDGLPYTPFNLHSVEGLKQISSKKQGKLNCLLQPQVIFESGINAPAILIDFVHFLKELTNLGLNLATESKDIEKCDCLFLRISIVLFGKRTYFPKIFPSKNNGRQCKLFGYSNEKRQKYTNVLIIFLADFMRALTKEIPEEQEEIDKIIMKMKNVDVNLYRETSNHGSKEGFFNKEETEKIFDVSRLKK